MSAAECCGRAAPTVIESNFDRARSRPARTVLFLLLVFSILIAAYSWLYENLWWSEKLFISPIALETALPIRNDELGEGSYGAKRRGNRSHRGLDIRARPGTLVRASRSGVARALYDEHGYGHYVKIEHDDGTLTMYAHLARVLVSDSSHVRQGQTIGKAGRSGNAGYGDVAPHLHFEIRAGDKSLDPLQLLSPFCPFEGPHSSRLGRYARAKMP